LKKFESLCSIIDKSFNESFREGLTRHTYSEEVKNIYGKKTVDFLYSLFDLSMHHQQKFTAKELFTHSRTRIKMIRYLKSWWQKYGNSTKVID